MSPGCTAFLKEYIVYSGWGADQVNFKHMGYSYLVIMISLTTIKLTSLNNELKKKIPKYYYKTKTTEQVFIL